MKPAQLQKWRKKNGYTQAALARALGVATMTVSRWETGSRLIPPFLRLALKQLEMKEKKSGDGKDTQSAFLQTLIDSIPIPIFYKDRKGIYTGCNRAFEKFLNLKKEQIVGCSVYGIAPRKLSDRYKKKDDELFKNPGTQVYESSVKDKKGKIHDVVFHKSTFKNRDGSLAGLIGAIFDITERKQAEKIIKESEEKYRTRFEEALDAIFVADAETGILVDCNREAEKLVGRKKSEMIGKSHSILHPPERIEGEFSKTFKQHLKEKEGQALETEVITKKGEIRDVSIKANLMEINERKVLQGIFRDITEKKKAEDEIRKFKTISDNASYGVVILDLGRNFLYVNEAYARMHGYSVDELIGKHNSILHIKESEEIAKGIVKELNRKGYADPVEEMHKRKDGSLFPVLIHVSLVRNDKGNPIFAAAVTTDITGRKKAEKAVKESEERFRTQFEEALDAIFVADAETGILVDCNREAEKLVGRKKSEMIGKSHSILHPPGEIKKGFSRNFKQHLKEKEGQALETEVITKKGEIRDVSIKANLMEINERKVLQGIFRDVTEQKRAERELQTQRDQLEALYETGKKVSSITSKEELLPWIAEQAARLLNADVCNYRIREGDYLIRGGGYGGGVELMKIEKLKIGESLSGLIAEKKKPLIVEDLIEDGRHIKEHNKIAKKLGFASFLGVPMMMGDKVVGVINVHTKKKRIFKDSDVTILASFADMAAIALANADYLQRIKESQHKLVRSEKLASVGKLASSVAHEILNPMNIISARTQLMMMSRDKNEEFSKNLHIIQAQVQRVVKISRALTALSREKKAAKKEKLDIDDIVTGALLFFEQNLSEEKNIRIKAEMKGGLPHIEGDKDELKQVFFSLLVNAAEAMPEGGEITVSTGLDKEKDGVLISVSDTGAGIPEENMGRIFDPFFTTKSEIKDVGLGLTICYGIVENHGGRIWVENNKDKGATFFVELPLSPKKQPL